jgi:urea transporter
MHSNYDVAVMVASVIIASFSSVIFVAMGKVLVPYKCPPLTLPFNVATLSFILAAAQMSHVDFGPVRSPSLPEYDSDAEDVRVTAQKFFLGLIRGKWSAI